MLGVVASTSERPIQHVTVDVVVLTVRAGELCALVVRRGEAPYKGRWALPGGFVGAGEDLVDAARRELVEETSVSPASVRLEQLATYGAPGRDPRRRTVSVAWLAVLPRPAVPERGTDRPGPPGARRTGCSDVDGSPSTTGRSWGTASSGPGPSWSTPTSPPPSSSRSSPIAQLREVYEVVWGHPLDAGNFHRKVTKTDGFVSPTGRRQSAGRGRPAELFTAGTEESLFPPLTRRSLA